MTQFDQTVMVTDATYLNAKYSPERFAVNIDGFMQIKVETDILNAKLSELVRMQKGRQYKQTRT